MQLFYRHLHIYNIKDYTTRLNGRILSQISPYLLSPMQKSFPLFRQEWFYFVERDGCSWTSFNAIVCNLITLIINT